MQACAAQSATEKCEGDDLQKIIDDYKSLSRSNDQALIEECGFDAECINDRLDTAVQGGDAAVLALAGVSPEAALALVGSFDAGGQVYQHLATAVLLEKDAADFCASKGVSGSACDDAWEAHVKEVGPAAVQFLIEEIPGIGDAIGALECIQNPSIGACAGAAVAVVPLVGGGLKVVVKKLDGSPSVTKEVDTPNSCVSGRCGSAIDGIYGNTRPMTDEFPELAGVNPHYVDGAGPGINTNCVSCVNATVDRLTGRNPNAVAGQSNGYGTGSDLTPSAPWDLERKHHQPT